MLLANVVGGKDSNKGRRGGSFLNRITPAGFLPFHQAHRADHLKSEFAGRFDGLHGGSTGGTNVVNDHNPRVLFPKSLDALSGAMLFFSFAHQETIQFSTLDGDRDHDEIGSHGQAADGLSFPFVCANLLQKNLAGQFCAVRVERGGTVVAVVVAAGTGRKLEFAQPKRLTGEHSQKFLARRSHESWRITRELTAKSGEH